MEFPCVRVKDLALTLQFGSLLWLPIPGLQLRQKKKIVHVQGES